MFANFGPTLDLVGKQVRTWPTWTNPFEILGEIIQDVLSLNTQTMKGKDSILILNQSHHFVKQMSLLLMKRMKHTKYNLNDKCERKRTRSQTDKYAGRT